MPSLVPMMRLEPSWSSSAHQLAPAGSVVVPACPISRHGAAGGPTVDQQRPTAYVCRHFVCKLPVTSVDDLALTIVELLAKSRVEEPTSSSIEKLLIRFSARS